MSAGMLIEWSRSSKYPYCSNTQPVCMFEQQRFCGSNTRPTGIYVAAAEKMQLSTRRVFCIDNVAVLADKIHSVSRMSGVGASVK